MPFFLGKQNKGLAKSEWKITCELFAPYAPEENPVEAIGLQLIKFAHEVLSFVSAKTLKLLIAFTIYIGLL